METELPRQMVTNQVSLQTLKNTQVEKIKPRSSQENTHKIYIEHSIYHYQALYTPLWQATSPFKEE